MYSAKSRNDPDFSYRGSSKKAVQKVCMYAWSSDKIAECTYQPGKVANAARGQLNRETRFFPVPVRA